MGTIFTADPALMNQRGGKIINQAEQFRTKIDAIYSKVDEMVNNDYLSPEAKVIAEKIYSYRDNMNTLQKTINEYGTFLRNASSQVVKNQEDIISGIKF